MWVPFAVLLGIFSLLVGGLAGHKVGKTECEMQEAVSPQAQHHQSDIETQK